MRALGDEMTQGAARSTAARTLRKELATHNAVLLPSPVPAEDKKAVFITIEVPDLDRANSLAKQLRNVLGVEAAYVKPGEALP